MTHEAGGNLIRTFFSPGESIRHDRNALSITLGSYVTGTASRIGSYRRTVDERSARLDDVDATLDLLVADVEQLLDLSSVDDYIAGVEDFNAELRNGDEGVRVLLTLLAPAPRWIIESPSKSTLQALGRSYSFDTLWEKYLEIQQRILRRIVRRYLAGRASPALCALEIGNEPDYAWTPEELKIEGLEHPLVYPLWKYVTELQLDQVPADNVPSVPFETTPGGGFQLQDGEWNGQRASVITPVTTFDWGAKFDWYVSCFGDFQARMADAIHDEARDVGVRVEVVSGSVTHNNVDYLLRMVRANPRSLEAVDKIGIHPYHWVRHDVWDTAFVDGSSKDDWAASSPREFARSWFKRFDFLEEIARCIRPQRRRFGRTTAAERATLPLASVLAGKRLWITEFGFGTKTLGAFNAPIAPHTRFIRGRRQVGAAGAHDAAVWEDLWESFLDQVDSGYLERNGVECILLYALREIGTAGFDMDDDDRSNLAVLHADGRPRMEQATWERVRELLGAVSGKSRPVTSTQTPGRELHRRPWRQIEVPTGVSEVVTMLSLEERRLLYWLARDYFTGVGAIVDGGSFVGGSTVALGEGLRANPRVEPGTRIDVFDIFEVDAFMSAQYFRPNGLSYVAGDSFRPFFDQQTSSVNDLLDVHAGDLAKIGWSGGPIEVFFVDIAKSWALNDVLVDQFFPELIPGRSVVVQQDLVFSSCPWLALTMEYLADEFEPVAFVEYNSLVYLCRRPVPTGVAGSLRALTTEQRIELMDRAIARFRGYPRGLLRLAKAVLLSECGLYAAAREETEAVRNDYNDDSVVLAGLPLVEESLAQTG
jgi:hypothetical protein